MGGGGEGEQKEREKARCFQTDYDYGANLSGGYIRGLGYVEAE